MGLQSIYGAVLSGNAQAAAAETESALAAGTPPADRLHKACIPDMAEVGRLCEAGKKFAPETLIAARSARGSPAWGQAWKVRRQRKQR